MEVYCSKKILILDHFTRWIAAAVSLVCPDILHCTWAELEYGLDVYVCQYQHIKDWFLLSSLHVRIFVHRKKAVVGSPLPHVS